MSARDSLLLCRKKKSTLEGENEEKGEDQAEESTPAHKDDEALQKKKADDLWALFLSDVGSRPKDCSGGSRPCSTAQVKIKQQRCEEGAHLSLKPCSR